MSSFAFNGYDKSKYSEQENSKFEQEFEQITEDLVSLLEAGELPDSKSVQAVIDRHYKFTCNFWIPTTDSYRSLAISYSIPSPARKTYESRKEGLAKFIAEAINVYAVVQLTKD